MNLNSYAATADFLLSPKKPNKAGANKNNAAGTGTAETDTSYLILL